MVEDTVEIEIEAGAINDESRAWAGMLAVMYQRWADRNGYRALLKSGTVEIRDGAKLVSNIQMFIVGPDAPKKFANEAGVHRLARLSPFDPKHRRHTSFATVKIDRARPVEGDWDTPRVGIRSYVLDPYTLVSDLRTGIKRDDVDAVLDGDINDFLTQP